MSSYSFQGRKRVWTPRDEEENRVIFSAMRQETGIKMPPEFKPVYLENAEYAVEKWSLKQLIRVLRLYGSHRCLWDVRDPDNKNRMLRKAALLDITAAMGGHMTMDQVLQKINVLRGTYRYEKRRIKKRMRKGLGASTKLKWFALADAFLRNVPRADKLKKTEYPVDSDSDLEDSVVFAIDPEVLNPLEEHEPDTQTSIEEEKHYNNSTEPAVGDPIGDRTLYSHILSRGSKNDYHESTVSSLLRRRWTSIESVHFVQLLREQPILWQNNFSTCTDIDYELNYQSALQEIANSMNLPVARILRRVRKIKLSYAEEKLKATSDASYKSNLVWFALADAFMMPSNTLQAPTFVDPNLLPPQTLNSTTESIRIKTEQITEENIVEADGKSEDVTPVTLINPIPSVASPSTLEDAEIEGLKCLFGNGKDKPTTDKLIDIRNENCSPIMTTVRSTVNDAKQSEASNPSSLSHATIPSFLKLIWNGLEDNLLEGKWSLKHSVKFLRLYGSHRCLWDLNDPCYRSRELRNAAIEDIAAAMGYGLDADYVAKKIKIFRITYMQHRKRMLEAYKDDKMEQEIQLRWFPLADSFLRPHIGLRSIKEHEREMPQFEFQYVYANLNLIDPALLNDIVGKGTQNSIKIGDTTIVEANAEDEVEGQEDS